MNADIKALVLSRGTVVTSRVTGGGKNRWASVTLLQGSTTDEGAYSPAQDVSFNVEAKQAQELAAFFAALARETALGEHAA